MTNTSFTPGPWTWESGWYDNCPGDSCDINKLNPDGSREWVGSANTQFTSIENGEANARLIAAAPEMYEMLMEIYQNEPVHPMGLKELLTRINQPV